VDHEKEKDTVGELVCQLAEGSRLKLVGLGGVGCIVLEFLAMFLRGLMVPARLVLIDGDKFEVGNIERMAFSTLGNKAEVKAAETVETLGDSPLEVVAVAEYINAENTSRLIRPGDYVFLCVDNHATRRLVSEHCETLSDVVLFSGGNDGVEPPERLGTYGNVQIAVRRDGQQITFPLTRLHPEIATAQGELPGGPHCGQLALSTPQILFANLAVASAMLNAFFAYSCGRLNYQEVQFDILQGRCVPHLPVMPIRPVTSSGDAACRKSPVG
jgi:hypothetical protein